MTFTLNPGQLTLQQLRDLQKKTHTLTLAENTVQAIKKSEKAVQSVLDSGKTVYGINTGFGLLAQTSIPPDQLDTLQESLLLSHAAGVGDDLAPEIVSLIMLLKINSLARGYSGVRLTLIETLIALYNHQIYPRIPQKGSVGASGDLAPLAHMSLALLGLGEVYYHGNIMPAHEALQKAGISPIKLAPKEGLALINGTQASTAIALQHLFTLEKLFNVALIAGAMSLDAAQGSDTPFDPRIHAVRGHKTQQNVAKKIMSLLSGSEIRNSHNNCQKVQDPYCLRCQPQVMGACLNNIEHARDVLLVEANAVSDNPLVFSEQNDIISGGNFHAEPVAIVADGLALSIAEIGAISERRIALLIDQSLSGLPPFLVENAGLNSGFMIAQVTAASLASENKSLAHPASVDSLPTSANQEDHVSMATFAARRLGDMIDNTATILAIELLAAAQGIDFRKPLKTSPQLSKIHATLREHVPFYEKDRLFSPDILAVKALVLADELQ